MGLRVALSSCYYGLGLHALSPRGRVLILMYHRVLSNEDVSFPCVQPGMYVTKSSFEQQVKYLRSHYTVLPLAKVLTEWRNGSLKASRRYCVLTFDDGWADTFLHAYPILRRYEIPATVFLTTSYIGTSRWFWTDRLCYLLEHVSRTSLSASQRREIQALAGSVQGLDCRSLLTAALNLPPNLTASLDRIIDEFKQLPADVIDRFLDRFAHTMKTSLPDRRAFLSWDEVSEMSQHGITFGSHTCTHPNLTNTPLGLVDRELRDSLATLRTKPIASIPVFCYPNGSYDDIIKSRVKEAGYMAAVTLDSGVDTTDLPDLFTIRRLGIHQDISHTPALFSLHLSGLVTALCR